MKKLFQFAVLVSTLVLLGCNEAEPTIEQPIEPAPDLIGVLDYYQYVPREYLQYDLGEPGERSQDRFLILDEENYYLQLGPNYEMAVFLQEPSSLFAISYREATGGNVIHFLKENDGEWIDVTTETLSRVDWDSLDPYLYHGSYFEYYFDLPQYGVKIEVPGLMNLTWRKGQFEVEYLVGVLAEQKVFTYKSGNDFSLEFPEAWTGVQTYSDFSGFGEGTESSPMCGICGMSTIFGFPSEDSHYPYFLFQVMELGVDDKGSELIPSDYKYLGENRCAVFYGAWLNSSEEMEFLHMELPNTYAILESDTPKIFDSFQPLEATCPI